MPVHICQKCRSSFTSNRRSQKFCSENCRGQLNRTTENQYKKIDNSLNHYLSRLLSKNNHIHGRSRSDLNRDKLKEIWQKQNGLCAMSGLPLTYRAEKGTYFPMNASIDCIVPISMGGSYCPDNVILVGHLLNSLMKHADKQQIIEVCRGVAAQADRSRPTAASDQISN